MSPAVSRTLGIASDRLPLLAPVNLQTVTLLGRGSFEPPLCNRCLSADHEPTGACSTLPLVGITIFSSSRLSSIEGDGESHADDICSLVTQVSTETVSPFDEPPRVLRYPVFPRLVLAFFETSSCGFSNIRCESAA